MNQNQPVIPKVQMQRPLIRAEQCGKCKWSSVIPTEANLQCRRFPPPTGHLLRQLPNRQAVPQAISYWPIVEPTQWCGEFRPNIEGVN